MMDTRKALATLEITEFKGIEDVKLHFRKLAHIYHPDKNSSKEAESRFREILSAYEFLLNNITDVYRLQGVPHDEDVEVTARSAIENLDDIFDDIFGFSKSGRVLGYQEPQIIHLSIEEFARGGERRQNLICYRPCPDCQGGGARQGTLARVCSYCFGHGTLTADHHQFCPKCHGRGRQMAHPCERCQGFGRLRLHKKLHLKLPIGLNPGTVYTLDGFDRGKKDRHQVFLKPLPLRHAIFQIDHYDLLCQYQLDFENRQNDLDLWLTTPFGRVSLTIPKESRPNDEIIIKGEGFFKDTWQKQRGDLKVRLRHRSSVLWKRWLDFFLGRKES